MPPARSFRVVLALAVLAACRESTTPAEETPFAAPIEGVPMADVFYGAYMDHDPAAGARDWSCGFKSYDGHGGVDILLRNFRVQDLGVPVIAAAGGTVIGTSDGLPDRNTTWDVGGYGNYVEISHPGGLTTIYGHLRRGSIAVTQGQQVEEGALLGLVGSSGKSNWPHLHFEVRRSGAAVDPFAGGCSAQESLWTNQLAYQDAFMVMDAGLTDQPVTLAALLERPPTLSAFPLNAGGFRLWIQTANQRASTVRYELHAPGGALRETVQQQVGATFSTRYLVLNVAVSGALSEAGAWEIRTYQDGQLIWTQPFTLLPAAAADAAGASVRAASTLEVQVLDQVPGADAHP
jgi:murein DD-endopeptidase MepM/ murein hydrolase activator NlpD